MEDHPDFLPQIDESRCNGCEICVKLCPNRVLLIRDGVAVIANPTDCDYSGLCQQFCPSRAVSLVYEIGF